MSDALWRELMLFRIDVVIIEPGTVNTAMYNKGEKEDLSEFKQTEYWEAVQNFQKFIVAEARNNGLSPERLGGAVHVAISTAKPSALRGRSATFQKLDSAQTSSCEDARRRGRKADGTQKAIARLGRQRWASPAALFRAGGRLPEAIGIQQWD
jgi:NAD(P)-dependent dehydrogenase (short-subunit alcohol dehydrogenase family)